MGGHSSFQGLKGSSYAILGDADNKPIFMDCGAYRAILKLKMLLLDAFGTPKNPGGDSSFQGLKGSSYAILGDADN